jgi:hypothetical protein
VGIKYLLVAVALMIVGGCSGDQKKIGGIDAPTVNKLRVVCAEIADSVAGRHKVLSRTEEKVLTLLIEQEPGVSQEGSASDLAKRITSEEIKFYEPLKTDFQYWTERWDQLGCSVYLEASLP